MPDIDDAEGPEQRKPKANPDFAKEPFYECCNCDSIWFESQLDLGAARHIYTRHDIGESLFSDTECPECGTLVYPCETWSLVAMDRQERDVVAKALTEANLDPTEREIADRKLWALRVITREEAIAAYQEEPDEPIYIREGPQ